MGTELLEEFVHSVAAFLELVNIVEGVLPVHVPIRAVWQFCHDLLLKYLSWMFLASSHDTTQLGEFGSRATNNREMETYCHLPLLAAPMFPQEHFLLFE